MAENNDDFTKMGFKEIVKNPGYWHLIGHQNADALMIAKEAESWEDEKLAALVHYFIFDVSLSYEAPKEEQILRLLGEKKHKFILDILSDPENYARLTASSDTDIWSESPFHRACMLFGRHTPPKEAISILIPFFSHEEKNIRRDAISIIASTGHFEIVSYLKTAFADKDHWVRSSAISGINHAIRNGVLDERIPNEIFLDVQHLLREDMLAFDSDDLLFALDNERAKAFYLSDEVLSPVSPIIGSALSILVKNEVFVSRDKLLSLISAFDQMELEHPIPSAFGEALHALGQHKVTEDRAILLIYMDHVDEWIANGAAAGLLVSHGLEDLDEKVWFAIDKNLPLTKAQKYYSAVRACDGQICNGGFAQYFVNSFGDEWQEALEGFEAMGFVERLSLVKQAIDMFGPAGPSENQQKRQIQLSKIYSQDEEIFEELETQYFNSKEVVDVFCCHYMIANQDHF